MESVCEREIQQESMLSHAFKEGITLGHSQYKLKDLNITITIVLSKFNVVSIYYGPCLYNKPKKRNC